MLTELCIEESICNMDVHCSVDSSNLPEQASDTVYMKDTTDLSGEGLNSGVETLSVTRDLSDHLCTENENLSKIVDTHEGSLLSEPSYTKINDLSKSVDSQENVPEGASKCIVSAIADPSCNENVSAEDLSRAHLSEGSSVEKLSVTQKLSDISYTEKKDISKTVDTYDLSGVDPFGGSLYMNGEPSLTKNVDALSGADYDEQLFTDDLDYDIMKLTVPQKLFEPFRVRDNKVTVAAFNCINTERVFEQSNKNRGKETICVSPQKRSLRMTRSRQNAQTAKPVRNQRSSTRRKVSVDFDSLRIIRRKRTFFGKRNRSAVWGFLTDLRTNEQNCRIDMNINKNKNPIRARGNQTKGKREKKKSKIAKVKVVEKVDEFSTGHFKTKVKFPELSKEEELPNSLEFQANDSLLGFHDPSNKSCNDCDKVGTPNDNIGLDPGTSPDSEVINLNLEAHIVGKGLEDLNDILSSSQDYDASSLKCIKKGKKNNKKSDDELMVEAEQGEKCSDVSYSANASGNTSSSTEGISKETLSCKVDSCSEINLSSSVGIEFESHMSNKGQKIPKSTKTDGFVKDSANKIDKSANKLNLKDELNGVETDHGECVIGNSSSNGDVNHKGAMEQIAKPRNAWVLCDDCHKWRRIQATLADQIEETDSKWSCKDNLDKKFADCSIPQEKSNAEINVELEISDASCDEDASDAQRKSNQLRKNQSADALQAKWKLVRSNLFLHRNRKNQTIDEIMVCHCKAPSGGRMGCGDGCLNRMLNIECVRGTCPCGELCSNQQFQKRKYAKLKCFKCGKKGYGLQGLEDISEGQFLIEYVGEVLDMHAYEARQKEYALDGHKHFYFMTLNGSEVIDACAKGNLGRFINHSCDPNCRTEKWMVNGEVCIGLFALRNIKKGEELTFDYNYVRVFGAAAKKCVCGSSQCRGYIGGDLQNAEVIVQEESDDDFPEPVMVREDGVVEDILNNKISVSSSFDCTKTTTVKESEPIYESLNVATKVESEVPVPVVGDMEIIEESGSDSLKTELSVAQETLLTADDLSSEIIVSGEQESSEAERAMKISSPSEDSPITMLNKSSPDSKKKLKSTTGKSRVISSKPSNSTTKISRLSSSVKKEKLKGVPVVGKKLLETPNKLDVKSKDASSVGRFEAVQEKLSPLLDPAGGISKRRDASRGYLKLLYLTAASGDSGNGETIQSNRDLSMILDALLKTKSRTVLVDIINKNGLQMLHNMLKRYRKEFNKIPILRKLLKVFEYLATREILTSEHINGGPPCPGVESFRESILSLTEHIDKQVHQTTRSFRDRWIPRFLRKNNCMDRDRDREECNNRFSIQQNNWSARYSEASETPSRVDTGNVEGSFPSCSSGTVTGTTRTGKRKSRWDVRGDVYPATASTGMGIDDDDDAPPGFEVPLKTKHEDEDDVVLGYPQHRFLSRLSVSYGVPLCIVETPPPQSGFAAPGMPFTPFPPLPPYDKNHQSPCDQKGPISDNNNNNNNNNLGRKFYRQQKGYNPKSVPPWVRNRNNNSSSSWGNNNSSSSWGNNINNTSPSWGNNNNNSPSWGNNNNNNSEGDMDTNNSGYNHHQSQQY